MGVAGFTSTGSKRPDVLFAADATRIPLRMQSSHGCTVRDRDGREYLDFIMGLGSVALGYGHPAVTAAALDAIDRGVTGALSPVDEEELAALLGTAIPWMQEIRFLKTGAEAVAAAVRLARVRTGRDRVLGCGYHGWLDWCSDAQGVPQSVRASYGSVPFNDCDAAIHAIRAAGDSLACVVVEPVIEAPPTLEWLQTLRQESARCGALLVFDEIKTAFRLAIGGAAERWGVVPDLMVIGKALANGFPLAAVGGSREVMRAIAQTWISSTAATEFVALAAATAVLGVFQRERVTEHLAARGDRLWRGLTVLAERHDGVVASGIPEMCYLRFDDDECGRRMAVAAAGRGLLFKRSAYNFVSLAHGDDEIDRAMATLDEILRQC
ncbi:MAG TPA: aminotransferase class III-fold pyridoxal phosphate-dependent enzyme [Gemmatimonadales bacterium]|jgi:glutamate-1-semialdehyde 2,1-aminomutase